MFIAKKNDFRGMSLLEMMVALGIFSILAFAMASLMNQHVDFERRNKITQTAQMLKQNAYDLIRNDLAWRNTLLADKSLDCICTRSCFKHTSVPKVGEAKRLLKLMDSGGGVFFDTTIPNMGYNFANKTCLSYPSRECPFRLEVSWRVMCNEKLPPIECPLFPMLEVTGKVYFNESDSQNQREASATRVSLNPENYSFNQFKTTDKTEGATSVTILDDIDVLRKRCVAGSELMKLIAWDLKARDRQPTGEGNQRPPSSMDIKDICSKMKKMFGDGAIGAALQAEIQSRNMGFILDQYQSICAGKF